MPELREALEAAITQSEAPPEPVSPPAESTPPPSEGAEPTPPNDAGGEADAPTPSPSEPEAPKEAAPKAEEPKGGEQPEKTPEQLRAEKREHRVDRAPQSWKKEAKGEWAQLPLNVRQEVYKRELEITRALSEAAPARQFAQQFEQTVAPFMARIQSEGVAPMEAVSYLLKADYTLATAPMPQRAAYMAQLIKQYGIDVRELDDALVGQQQPQQSTPGADISAIVQQQVQQMVAPLLQREQAQQQRIRQGVITDVEQMEMNPEYPYFEDVRGDMADIIEMHAKKGLAITLQQAYSKAIRMNDDVQAQIEQGRSVQNAQQVHQKAQQALRASSSVSGSPASGGSMTPTGDGSLRGAIEAAFGANRI